MYHIKVAVTTTVMSYLMAAQKSMFIVTHWSQDISCSRILTAPEIQQETTKPRTDEHQTYHNGIEQNRSHPKYSYQGSTTSQNKLKQW